MLDETTTRLEAYKETDNYVRNSPMFQTELERAEAKPPAAAPVAAAPAAADITDWEAQELQRLLLDSPASSPTHVAHNSTPTLMPRTVPKRRTSKYHPGMPSMCLPRHAKNRSCKTQACQACA